MKTLTRLTFVLALAACGGGSNINNSPCEVDPTLPECQQTCNSDAECGDGVDCTTDACNIAGVCEHLDTCAAAPSAEIRGSVNPNGTMFIDGIYDDSQPFVDFLDEGIAADDALVVGECIDLGAPAGGPTATGKPMGNLQLLKGSTLLLDLVQGTDGGYEGLSAAGSVAFGDVLDIVLTGSTVIAAADLDGALIVPAALPAITDPLTNNTVTLAPTIHYTPLAVSFLKIRFSFIDGQGQIVTISCRLDPAATSITMAQTTFDRLPQNGSIFLEAYNRRIQLVDAADGVARSVVSVVGLTSSVSYQKP